jgi:hypothetical protein
VVAGGAEVGAEVEGAVVVVPPQPLRTRTPIRIKAQEMNSSFFISLTLLLEVLSLFGSALCWSQMHHLLFARRPGYHKDPCRVAPNCRIPFKWFFMPVKTNKVIFNGCGNFITFQVKKSRRKSASGIARLR